MAQHRGPARMPRRGDLASGCRRGKMEQLRHIAATVSEGEGGRRWGMKLGRPAGTGGVERPAINDSPRRISSAMRGEEWNEVSIANPTFF
jgi:hypothetical protein